MMEGKQILANPSEVENPRRFAKNARTLKIQYVWIFHGHKKSLEIGFGMLKLTLQMKFAKIVSGSLSQRAFHPAQSQPSNPGLRD